MNFQIRKSYNKLQGAQAESSAGQTLSGEPLCRRLALRALSLSEGREASASGTWRNLLQTCKKESVDFSVLLNGLTSWGYTLVEGLLRSDDWSSCNLVQGNMKNGSYADGKVVRTCDTLIFVERQGEPRFGFVRYPGGTYYGGELKNMTPEGRGNLYVMDEWHFEGEWKNGVKHGWGAFANCKQKTFDEGLYIDDIFRGNPKASPNRNIPETIPLISSLLKTFSPED